MAYKELHHASQDIQNWLQNGYNQIRPHKYNGGLSPCEYEINGDNLRRYPDFEIRYPERALPPFFVSKRFIVSLRGRL
ncbi:MAG: hypothetical protein G5703_01275 [Serratia symbiotica]|nr:hypothetical protein [Serratia symbiotica]